MKEIYAIIQMSKINATKVALAAKGIYALNAYPALGHGKGQVEPSVLEAAAKGSQEAISILGEHPQLGHKRTFSIMVDDDRVDEVVNTIVAANQTGNHGDGKIFICPLEEVVRISSGERGPIAL